jgi:hypothetical protein
VPEGSGLFAHSSLKTPFSAMGTHDGRPVPTSERKIGMTFFFFLNVLPMASVPRKKQTKEVLYYIFFK